MILRCKDVMTVCSMITKMQGQQKKGISRTKIFDIVSVQATPLPISLIYQMKCPDLHPENCRCSCARQQYQLSHPSWLERRLTKTTSQYYGTVLSYYLFCSGLEKTRFLFLTQPSGFFLFLLGFRAFQVFLYTLFAQKRQFLGFQFQEYFQVHPDFKL